MISKPLRDRDTRARKDKKGQQVVSNWENLQGDGTEQKKPEDIWPNSAEKEGKLV